MSPFNTRIDSNNVLIIVLVALNLFLLSAFWFMKGPGLEIQRAGGSPPEAAIPPPPSENDRFAKMFKKELQLNEEQAKELQVIRITHFDEMRFIHDDLSATRGQMFGMMHNDVEKARKLAAKVSELESQRNLLLIDHYQQLKQLCQPAQQIKLQKVFLKAMRRGHQPGGRKPPPPRK